MSDATPAAVFIHPTNGQVMAVSNDGTVAVATPPQIQAFVGAGNSIAQPSTMADAQTIAQDKTPDGVTAQIVPASPQPPSPSVVAQNADQVKQADPSLKPADAPTVKPATLDTKTVALSKDIPARLDDVEKRLSAVESVAGQSSATTGSDLVSRFNTMEEKFNRIANTYFANEI